MRYAWKHEGRPGDIDSMRSTLQLGDGLSLDVAPCESGPWAAWLVQHYEDGSTLVLQKEMVKADGRDAACAEALRAMADAADRQFRIAYGLRRRTMDAFLSLSLAEEGGNYHVTERVAIEPCIDVNGDRIPIDDATKAMLALWDGKAIDGPDGGTLASLAIPQEYVVPVAKSKKVRLDVGNPDAIAAVQEMLRRLQAIKEARPVSVLGYGDHLGRSVDRTGAAP